MFEGAAVRDDFTEKTKTDLAKRVSFLCSNPECQRTTVGPNEEPNKYTSIGVAAHICAASKGGPRFDPAQDKEARRSILNGIWLCQNCSVLIDRDEDKFSAELLLEWKSISEKSAWLRLSDRMGNIPPSLGGDGNFEPIEENAYYEKDWGGSAIRYYLKDNFLHVEHEIDPGLVAYYVLDQEGNIVDHKMPFPLKEYEVEIDPDLILEQVKSVEQGMDRIDYRLKWGKVAIVIRNSNGELEYVRFPFGGVTMNHREKKYVAARPEFKK